MIADAAAICPWTAIENRTSETQMDTPAIDSSACEPENAQAAGRLRWWQVLGSNQRSAEPTVLQAVGHGPSEWPLTWDFFIKRQA
jgi:hypothetical protein